MNDSLPTNAAMQQIRAFIQTVYRVEHPTGRLNVLIGKRCDALDQFFTPRSWCIITAFNPNACIADEESNLAADQRLCQRLEMLSETPPLRTRHKDPTERWPDELGWAWSFGDAQSVHSLAGTFQQRAVVCGGAGRLPELWFYANESGDNRIANQFQHVRIVTR